MKTLENRRQLPVMLTKRDRVLCNDEEELTIELLDAFFTKSEPHQTLKNDYLLSGIDRAIELKELKEIVNRLPSKKAPGPDGFNGVIFKRYFAKRGKQFAELFSSCISIGQLPLILKTGRVVPVPKGNNETNYRFFRPITLLSIAEKCVEKIFIDLILNEVKEKNMWRHEQYGFTKGKSAEDALKKLVDTLKDKKSSGENCLLISLDIAEAFDNIGHSKLIDLLKEYKVSPNLIRTVISYF